MAILDVLRLLVITLASLIYSPNKLPLRSWGSEFIFRLGKRLIRESVGKPIGWLRKRQEILTFKSSQLLKVNKKFHYVNGVPCVTVVPKSVASPDTVIIYLHGGGYVFGSVSIYALTLARISLKTGAIVIAPDYRLAPEHPIPAPQEDCQSVAEAILKNSEYKDKKIILMGDSAGGGLCLSTINGLNSRTQEKSVNGCVLLSPFLASSDNDWSEIIELDNEKNDILDRAAFVHITNMFRPNEQIVNLLNMNITNLPPLYIQAGGAEVLIKQITTFANRLEQENANYKFEVFEQQFHVFQIFAPLVKEEAIAIEKVAEFVRSIPYENSY